MSLIVEDGSVVTSAESYCSVAHADSYHTSRGNFDWLDLSTDEKESALRKATDYMVGQYSDKWDGYKKDADQALDWPRENVRINGLAIVQYLSDSIVPSEVKNACASLAFRSSSADLLADEEKDVVSETVDVISTVYSQHSPQRKRYPEIDAMLRKYLVNTGGALRMVKV